MLLVLAPGQLISPLFLFLGNGSLQADGPGEPPIVAAGYTFVIWAVIGLLGAVYAVWQLPARGTAVDRLLDDVAWPLAGVFAGFSLWLVFASTGPRWATVVVFAVMLVLLLVALRTVLRADVAALSRSGRALLRSTLGVYAGWTSIAVWVNLTTAVVVLGAPTTGVLGTAGQLAVLVAATVTACAIAVWTGGLLSFAGAAAWALVGAAVGAGTQGASLLPRSGGTSLLAAAAVGGLVLLGAATVTGRRRPASA